MSKTIIFGISASIAAYRSYDLIRDLTKENMTVIPVLSQDAHHFISPLVLQSLSSQTVYQSFFDPAINQKPIHTELAKIADLIVVSPASADIIAKIRIGLANDLLTCTLLAARSPILLVPAMNDHMYNNPATQENLEVLRMRGLRILDPIEGDLVCEDKAIGHIADNESIKEQILDLLNA